MLHYFSVFCVFNLGECDHLPLYPVYSEQIHQNLNITAWDKTWPLEIDWLNSYVNLSSYPQAALEGLTIGYQTTKYAKYFTSSRWGCVMMFKWDAESVDSYYLGTLCQYQ